MKARMKKKIGGMLVAAGLMACLYFLAGGLGAIAMPLDENGIKLFNHFLARWATAAGVAITVGAFMINEARE